MAGGGERPESGARRLARAIDVAREYDASGRAESKQSLLARHPELFDLLEPMLEDPGDVAPAPPVFRPPREPEPLPPKARPSWTRPASVVGAGAVAAASLLMLGELARARPRPDAGEALVRAADLADRFEWPEAESALRDVLASDPPARVRREATALLADVLSRSGRLEAAERMAERALDLEPPDDGLELAVRLTLAEAERERGDCGAAAAEIESALRAARATPGDGSAAGDAACEVAGLVALDEGRTADAIALLRRAADAPSPRGAGRSPVAWRASRSLALAEVAAGQEPEAAETLGRAYDRASDRLGPDSPIACVLAGDLADRVPGDEALDLARRAASGLARACGEDHPRTLEAKRRLARMLRDRSERKAARGILAEVAAALARQDGDSHPRTLEARAELATCPER
jgi:tetratricopeptide (TPR) repeat protein